MADVGQLVSAGLDYTVLITYKFILFRKQIGLLGLHDFSMRSQTIRPQYYAGYIHIIIWNIGLIRLLMNNSHPFANNQFNLKCRADGHFFPPVMYKRDDSENLQHSHCFRVKKKKNKSYYNWEMIHLTTVIQAGGALGELIRPIESLGHKQKWFIHHIASRAVCKSQNVMVTSVKISKATVCSHWQTKSKPYCFYQDLALRGTQGRRSFSNQLHGCFTDAEFTSK